MIEFFIDVAQECFNIGNFNSLMAIISECCTHVCRQAALGVSNACAPQLG